MENVVIWEGEREFKPVKLGRTKNLFGPENVGAKHLKINIKEYAAGTEHEFHSHLGQEEVIFVLDGEGIARTEEGDKPIKAGAFVFIPAGMKHATINILKEKSMKTIIIKSPPGDEKEN